MSNQEVTGKIQVLFICLFINLIILLSNPLGIGQRISTLFSKVFSPWESWAMDLKSFSQNSFQSVSDITSLKSKYDDLRVKFAESESKNALSITLAQENVALKTQLKFEANDWKYTQAMVLAGGDSSDYNYLTINKGSASGIKVGDVVSFGNIFIGIVSGVNDDISKVSLLNSEKLSLKVAITPDDVNKMSVDEISSKYGSVNSAGTQQTIGVTAGSIAGVQIENIDNNSQVNVGDNIVSLDEKTGDKYFIGRVSSIKSENVSASKVAVIELPLEYSSLTYVFVRLGRK